MLALALLLPLVSLAVEVPAQRIRAEVDFPGLEIPRQRELLDHLARSNQYGRYLSAYYVPLDAAELSWVNPQLRLKLYRMNARGSESNCYWTSHFAGPVEGPYLIMNLWDLMNRIYVGSQVKEVYRLSNP